MSENITGLSFGGILYRSLKFILLSYIISVILIALLAVLIVYTDISEKIAPMSVKGITLFGAFLSSFLLGLKLDSKGWLFGTLTGVLNIFILLLTGMATIGTDIFSKGNVSLMLLGGFCGIVGGITGLNLGHN